MQPYMPLNLARDETKTVHITPPNDDYVALATNPIFDMRLKDFGVELFDMTGEDEKADGNFIEDTKELSIKTDVEIDTFIQKLLNRKNTSMGARDTGIRHGKQLNKGSQGQLQRNHPAGVTPSSSNESSRSRGSLVLFVRERLKEVSWKLQILRSTNDMLPRHLLEPSGSSLGTDSPIITEPSDPRTEPFSDPCIEQKPPSDHRSTVSDHREPPPVNGGGPP
ncbi:hypothetical protein Tco_0277140 [Tanacetum coccineum]